MQKVKLIAELDAFRKDFASMEKELINKYGDKVQINLQTGEVNPPKEEDVMERSIDQELFPLGLPTRHSQAKEANSPDPKSNEKVRS